MEKRLITQHCLLKKLLFTMKNAATAGSSQSNISRLYISEDNNSQKRNQYNFMGENCHNHFSKTDCYNDKKSH